MTAALVLVGYAVLVGTGVAAALRSARWPQACPALGVVAWQVLSFSIVIALVLAGLLVLLPAGVFDGNMADLLHTCLMELRAQYATPGGAAAHLAGAGLLGLVVVRSALFLVQGLRAARRDRRGHLAGLRLVARRDSDIDALVVEHPIAAAYCLPGRARTIVLTSTALAALDDTELAAVLAHERAHLRGRHHLVLAMASAVARAVPLLPGLRWAHLEQSRLLEMLADDAAAGVTGRRAVATAVLQLAGANVPATLGAADVAAGARVHRLLTPPKPLAAAARIAIVCALLVLGAAPATIAAVPTLAAAQIDTCPLPPPPPQAT